MKKRIVACLLICVVVVNMAVPRAKAFEAVSAGSAGAYLLLGTIITAVGYKAATDADLQEAVAVGWQRTSEDVRNVLETAAAGLAEGADRVVKFTADQCY